jgi:hypothetical protein
MIYRKVGRVVRYEHGRLLSISESGEAIENGETFIAAPINDGGADALVRPPGPGRARLDAAPMADKGVRRSFDDIELPRIEISDAAGIERLIVSEGIAVHRCGDVEWRERTRRLHVSLVHDRIRALVDLADFDFEFVNRIAEELARAGAEREAPQRIRLAPNVTAALLPSLVGVAPPNIELWQTADGRDGKGQLIDEVRIEQPPWPNWYRPSYRVRPIRAPMNLRAVCEVGDVDRDLPEAIALVAPVDGLTLRVLIRDRDAVYPATVHVSRIDAVAPPAAWYPYAAGAWGAEMLL